MNNRCIMRLCRLPCLACTLKGKNEHTHNFHGNFYLNIPFYIFDTCTNNITKMIMV